MESGSGSSSSASWLLSSNCCKPFSSFVSMMLSWASSVRKKVSSSARSRATQVAASVGWQKVSQVASSFSSSVASGPAKLASSPPISSKGSMPCQAWPSPTVYPSSRRRRPKAQVFWLSPPGSSSRWRCWAFSPQRMPAPSIQRSSTGMSRSSSPKRWRRAGTSSRSSTSLTVRRSSGRRSSFSSAIISGRRWRLAWSESV